MDKQIIRESILDVIDEGDPRCDCDHRVWHFYLSDEAESNAARLDFADAVQARIEMKLAMKATDHLEEDAQNRREVRVMSELVTKQDVVLAVANTLMRLGKNDFEGAARQFDRARITFDEWMRQRPEKERSDLIAEQAATQERLAELNIELRNHKSV